MSTLFILESVNNPKFPYRLTLRQGEKILLALRVQDRWPGQKGHVFCLREENNEYDPPVEELERVPVISLKRYGKRLAVVLDRPVNKRCDFLFLKKEYKTKEGEYEQIFWRTQKALKERKPKVKLTTYPKDKLNLIIDTNERYAWKFPASEIKKDKLPVGDYALVSDSGIIAIVERKTFENLVAEFNRMAVLHQQLGELEAYRHAAMVIEANYSDFLNSDKIKFYSPSFAAKAIAELYALHPKLTIVFAGNRKLANEWTYRFFSAINAHENDLPHAKVSEIIEEYGTLQETTGGINFEIKKKLIEELPEEFSLENVKEIFPDVTVASIKKVLDKLSKEGILEKCGSGKKIFWKKL